MRKWVDCLHASVLLTGVEALRVHDVARKHFCAPQDHGISETDVVMTVNIDRLKHIRSVRGVNAPMAEVCNNERSGFRGKRMSNLACHGNKEFLQ